jgi:hypothetical protein
VCGCVVSGAAEDCSVGAGAKQAAAAANFDLDDVSDFVSDADSGVALLLHEFGGDYSYAWIADGGEGGLSAYTYAERSGGEGGARVLAPVGLVQQAPLAEHAVDAVVLAFLAPSVRVHHGAQSF